MTMFLKVCGITRVDDALHAAREGATALGFIFWPESPRYVSPEHVAAIVAALPRTVTPVGVFVNQAIDEINAIVGTTRIAMIQLHGDEDPVHAGGLTLPLLRAVGVGDAKAICPMWPAGTTFLLDAQDPVKRGGTGRTVDWTRATDLARRWPTVLAGGLTPDNVTEAIEVVRPIGVDVSSGVEVTPGVKDQDKVTRFLQRARTAFEAVAQ